MNGTTATEAIAAITEHAQSHVDDERLLRTPAPLRQGDIYLAPLAAVPDGLERIQERQLAPGSTKGSRHVAEGDGLELFVDPRRDAITGPVVRARQRWTLTHPEHANVSMPSGVYQVYYQRNLESEELARVRD